MLEKNEKIFADSHFHYTNSLENQCFNPKFQWKGCSCAHSIEEWNCQKENSDLIQSFGIHPQLIADNEDLLKKYLDFEEDLLQNNQLNAIGEIGFDFFTEDFKSYKELQEKYFVKQLNLAQRYEKPVVIHCRKANEKLFEYSSELKKLPSVLFHSFMGTSIEAKSLLKKGIKGYFSFGKQILNNNKKVIDCTKNLPLENLLLETDAPYQFLKGETRTYVNEIELVYKAAAELRNISLEEFCQQIKNNFEKMYHIHF